MIDKVATATHTRKCAMFGRRPLPSKATMRKNVGLTVTGTPNSLIVQAEGVSLAIETPSAWTIRLFGVPVTVKPTFFLIVALLGSGRLPNIAHFLVWVAVATLSIMWHEFGHVIAFRAFGCHSTVELWSFGGQTRAT